MKFIKMHGLGNDYVFLGPEEAARVQNPSQLSIEVSRAHFGVGADGLVLILPSEVADAKMRIFNLDGSEAEMCGNALRCVGKYLYETGRIEGARATIETGGGLKAVRLNLRDGKVRSVVADMGAPAIGEVLALDLGGRQGSFVWVSMGSPNAVTYDLFPCGAEFEHFGPYVERHPHFPNRTNVEFCRVESRGRAEVRVWERGSGATLACGTGAAAAFAAGVHLGLLDSKAEIHLPGGKLLLKVGKNGHLLVSGPAEMSFIGELPEA